MPKEGENWSEILDTVFIGCDKVIILFPSSCTKIKLDLSFNFQRQRICLLMYVVWLQDPAARGCLFRKCCWTPAGPGSGGRRQCCGPVRMLCPYGSCWLWTDHGCRYVTKEPAVSLIVNECTYLHLKDKEEEKNGSSCFWKRNSLSHFHLPPSVFVPTCDKAVIANSYTYYTEGCCCIDWLSKSKNQLNVQSIKVAGPCQTCLLSAFQNSYCTRRSLTWPWWMPMITPPFT